MGFIILLCLTLLKYMNNEQLQSLSQKLNLGKLVSEPERVAGGLLHRMYRIITTKGQYAVKKMNPSIKTKENIRKKYQYTEDMAALFSEEGVPALLAYRYQNDPIIEIGDDWFMVFDWMNGTTLSPEQIDPEHAKKIGELLFLMHCLNLSSKEKWGSSFDYFPDNHWKSLLEQAKSNQNLFSKFDTFFPVLLDLNQNFHHSISELNKKLIISHADLDPKNVIWKQNGNPIVVDWESVRPVNPTLELIACALDWSGITIGEINNEIYKAFLDGYQSQDAENRVFSNDIKIACYGVAGNWLAWLEFNVRRALGEVCVDEEDKTFGFKMSIETMSTLLRLNNFINRQ